MMKYKKEAKRCPPTGVNEKIKRGRGENGSKEQKKGGKESYRAALQLRLFRGKLETG